MKVKNKPGKKLLAMLLAGAMALAMLPVFIIPASGSDIFRDIFGEPDARVVPGAAAGKLPYRDGAPLLTVCEPLVGGVGMGEKNFIFGQYGTLGMEPTAANGYTARALPGGSEFWLGDYTLEETERTNVSLKRVLKLYEGNFNGDGRKNQLAVLCLANVRIGSDDSLDVVLFVCNADDNRWMTPVASFGRVDTKTGDADYVKDLFYCYDLACADLDGDGFDEIIVAPKGKSHLSVFSLIAGADWQTWEASGGWKAPVNVPFGDPTYNAGQTSAPSASDLAMGSKGMTFSMAVGDVDRDGCEDIVYVASGTKKGDFTGAYRSAYVLYGDKTLSKLSEANQQQKLNIDMQEGNGKGSNEGQRAFGRFGVTIASMPGGPPDKETKLPAGSEPRIFLAFEEYNNLDFNGKSDTCRCHYYSIGSLRFVSRSSSFQWSFVCRRENTLNGGSDPVRYLDQRKHTAALKINYLMYGYGLHDTNTVKTNNPYAWGSLLVNGELTPFAVSLGEAKSNVYQTGDSRNLYNKDKGIDFNREVFSQRACTVTGDGDGVMVHWLDGGKRYIKYFDCSTDTAKNSEGESTYQGYKEVPALSMEAKSSDWLYFALPDVNNDSLFLKFQRHEFFWSDPRVAAALASPPYYDSLPNAQGATTFGQIVQSANGTTKAYSDSAGAYVSLEGKLGCELFKVVVEAEVAYDHTWTNETEKMSTVTYSIEKSAPAGTDVVLLATNAFDVYTYTLYSPTGDNPTGRYGEEDYVVVVPRNDRYASKLIDVSYDEYKEFRRNDTKDILPDLSEVFTHTPGKPETYPETTPAFAENTLLSIPSQYPRVSSTALSIETTEEVTNTKLESNTVSAKLGIGFEAGSDKIGGVKAMVGGTYAHDWTNGKITSNATGVYTGGEIYRQEDSKIGFGVELIRYTYTNNPEKLPGKETYGFPVVTYLLSDVQQPDGTAPDGAVYVYALGDNGGIVEEAYPSAPNNVKYHVTAPGVTGNSSTMLVGAPEGMTLATGNIASADEDFTIALDSHVKPGTYKLKLMVGGKESNEFKLTVTPRKYDLRVANKNTGETQPLQSVKGGDWVDVDVSAWKGGSTYFMWTNDDADLINAKHTQKEIAGGEGFHRTQPVLRFRMPGQDLNLEADFHGHPEDIARIRCVDLGDYSGGTRITNEPARSSLHTQGVNAALLWADFGNGLDGAAYTRVRADADYAPDVTWTLDGSYTGSGAATGIEASGAILGSPSAILTLGSGELSEKITVTATSKATGIKKSIAIPIDQPKLAVTANPSPVIFTADEPGYTAADLSKKVNLFNNNSMSGVAADGSITFKECTMAGDDPAAFQLATSLAGTTLKARQEKPIFVCPAAGLTE
ncbi:MAG: VCBS repeat-containing protein, partial [Firmicutes bacterium]|nr:VCBS repeat-containing protein [Bacillota bacterium]